MVRGAWISYSYEELEWIKAYSKLPRAEALAKFHEKFGRHDVTLANFHSLCKRKGWMTGRDGRFDKGSVSHNKGKKCAPGKMGNHPNARKTQFKPGHLGGTALQRVKPIGTERITRDGYIERKINNDMPMQARWRAVHLIRWEEIHGKLPKGSFLKCLDGDPSNTDPSNWKCLSRGVQPYLNGKAGRNYEQTPTELRPTVLALAQVKHMKNKAMRNGKNDERKTKKHSERTLLMRKKPGSDEDVKNYAFESRSLRAPHFDGWDFTQENIETAGQ